MRVKARLPRSCARFTVSAHGWLVDAGSTEPVSIKFPANREVNREFCENWPATGILMPKSASQINKLQPNSLRNGTGNFRPYQGASFKEQAISRQVSGAPMHVILAAPAGQSATGAVPDSHRRHSAARRARHGKPEIFNILRVWLTDQVSARFVVLCRARLRAQDQFSRAESAASCARARSRPRGPRSCR
jgi:hypothetical protein